MLPSIGINLERDKLLWEQAICNRINQAVRYECQRTKVAAKFLRMHGLASPGELTVPADTVIEMARCWQSMEPQRLHSLNS